VAGVNTVRAIQELVRANGINVRVDGIYGKQTRAAASIIDDPVIAILVSRLPVAAPKAAIVDSSVARALVRAACDRFGVRYDKVALLVDHESQWNANVTSSTGAVGLFQLTSWPVRQYNKDEAPSVPIALGDRFDLETNVMIGVWYIRYCAKQVGENPLSGSPSVWARIYGAYNLGPGTFLSWERGVRSSDVVSSWAVQSSILRKGGIDNYALNAESLFV
jgi:soluble lytic murein transglycosylase-like protein